MPFDPVKKFIDLHNRFIRARGSDAPSGKRHEVSQQPLFATNQLVPRTTWGDVLLVGSSFLRWADPDDEGCVQLYKEAGSSEIVATAKCLFGHPHADFVRTPSYNRAKALFEKYQPLEVATRQHGLFLGMPRLAEAVTANIIYPHNEEFWGYGRRFAIERSAAGIIPGKFEIAVEALKESVTELPDTVARPFEAAIDAADKFMPDLGSWADLAKWTTIGGSAFLLYWYVLRPKRRFS